MTLEILLKYTHFLCIFAIVGALVSEHLLLAPTLPRATIKRLATIDGIYGIAALLLLGAGFTLWFGVGKPADFYSRNWIFHLKLGLFTLVGLLSLVPTIYFLKHRKGDPTDTLTLPTHLIWIVRIELLLLAIIPLTASLMAKGIGYFGS